MRRSSFLQKPRFPKEEIGIRHSRPYPNLPWLMAHKPTFMDHAEHIYGRREKWDEMMTNPESPTQHHPMKILLEACLKLEKKIKATKRRNAQFTKRSREADEYFRQWMKLMMRDGVRCLENFRSPQEGPIEKASPSEKKDPQESVADSTHQNKVNRSGRDFTKANLDETPPVQSMPFLQQRLTEDPSSLDPYLSEWAKRHQGGPEVIEVLPTASEPSASDAVSSEKPLKKGKSERKQRRPAARTMKQFMKQRPVFDSQYTFEQKKGKVHAKVDWETLRGAAVQKGYDRKRALERKIRLKRGEDV